MYSDQIKGLPWYYIKSCTIYIFSEFDVAKFTHLSDRAKMLVIFPKDCFLVLSLLIFYAYYNTTTSFVQNRISITTVSN